MSKDKKKANKLHPMLDKDRKLCKELHSTIMDMTISDAERHKEEAMEFVVTITHDDVKEYTCRDRVGLPIMKVYSDYFTRLGHTCTHKEDSVSVLVIPLLSPDRIYFTRKEIMAKSKILNGGKDE